MWFTNRKPSHSITDPKMREEVLENQRRFERGDAVITLSEMWREAERLRSSSPQASTAHRSMDSQQDVVRESAQAMVAEK